MPTLSQKARIARRTAAEAGDAITQSPDGNGHAESLKGGLGSQSVGVDADVLQAMLIRTLASFGIVPQIPHAESAPLTATPPVLESAPNATKNVDTIAGETEEQELERKLAALRARRTESQSGNGQTIHRAIPPARSADFDSLPSFDKSKRKVEVKQFDRKLNKEVTVEKSVYFPAEVRGWLTDNAPPCLVATIATPDGQSVAKITLARSANAAGGLNYGVQGGECTVLCTDADGNAAYVNAEATGIYFVLNQFQKVQRS